MRIGMRGDGVLPQTYLVMRMMRTHHTPRGQTGVLVPSSLRRRMLLLLLVLLLVLLVVVMVLGRWVRVGCRGAGKRGILLLVVPLRLRILSLLGILLLRVLALLGILLLRVLPLLRVLLLRVLPLLWILLPPLGLLRSLPTPAEQA